MKKLKRILYPICAAVILFSLWNLWKIKCSTEKETQLYQNLAEQAHAEEPVEEPAKEEETPPVETAQAEAAPTEEPKEEPKEESNDVLEGGHEVKNQWLIDLQKQNPELVAWITIPGTVIDYPVMQTAEDNDFYLNHDFARNEDPHGTPFLDVSCRIGESENLIIYGHHMKDQTMFQNLIRYKDAEFCRQNGVIEFDTENESEQYQVQYVLLISEKDTEDFPYSKCVNLPDEESYQSFLNLCEKYAIWTGPEPPAPGTKLLTLATCEYSRENGRLVIVSSKKNK